MMRGQRGQVMAFIAVALGMVLMPLAAYAIDVATVSAAAATLEEATATAAIEAAQQLDPDIVARMVALDPGRHDEQTVGPD